MALTKACSQPGMVRAGTKTLLAKVRGNTTTLARLMTVAESRITRATMVHTHDKEDHGGA